jgi:hypothetical protein
MLTEQTQSTSEITRNVPSVGHDMRCVACLLRVIGWVIALTEK